MGVFPKQIQRLIGIFSKFPTVGQRTATRFAFYLLKMSVQEADELIFAIKEFKRDIKLCSLCFAPFDSVQGRPFDVTNNGKEGLKILSEAEGLCEICLNPIRDSALLCIVEKESDLEAIESSKHYQGLYFVLGGTLGTLKKEERNGLRIKELQNRMSHSPITEVIIATNPTPEGEATALYIARVLKDSGVKITRLGRGLSIGAELEYADQETIRESLEGRR